MRQLQHTTSGFKIQAKTHICALAVLFSLSFFSFKNAETKPVKCKVATALLTFLFNMLSSLQKIRLQYFGWYTWTKPLIDFTGDLKMKEKSSNPFLFKTKEFNSIKRERDVHVMYSYLLSNIHENKQSKFKGEKFLII